MKLIISGGRDIRVDIVEIDALLTHFDLSPHELVCGMASGVDAAGLAWAKKRYIKVAEFPALWKDLDAPRARIKINSYGEKYNANAGRDRNRRMAEYGDRLLLIWNGRSPGSASMKIEMSILEKRIYEVIMPSKND